MPIPSEYKDLYELACNARKNAYAEYSKYYVGVALRTSDGKTYTGCNVENSSFGAAICAERVAILKAISEGSREISEVFLVTQSSPLAAPCGLCLQMISEFAKPETPIHLSNIEGDYERLSFSDCAPKAFTPDLFQPGKGL